MGATIKDVAKLAGTSTATVSKVMNGSYSISQETADKVRKAMEELDYHPNLRAKNFARQSARTIIFVAELGKGTGFANPQMFEILCGLEEVLAQKDYTLVVRNIAAGDCAEFIRNAADTKQADGFVIHASVISQALDGDGPQRGSRRNGAAEKCTERPAADRGGRRGAAGRRVRLRPDLHALL